MKIGIVIRRDVGVQNNGDKSNITQLHMHGYLLQFYHLVANDNLWFQILNKQAKVIMMSSKFNQLRFDI